MERKQITPLLVSYAGMTEVNDLCGSLCSLINQDIANNAEADTNLIQFVTNLNTENDLLTLALNFERRLNNTVDVKLNDKGRDSYCTTFYGVVKAFVGSPIEAQGKSAERIYRILKNNGGNPSRFSMEKQSSIMESVFAEIDAVGVEDIKKLNLTSLYTGMVEAQKTFKDSEISRNADKVQKQNSESASELLKRVMLAYTDVEDFLNLMVRISPSAYSEIVSEVDALVTSLNTKLRARNTNKVKDVVD